MGLYNGGRFLLGAVSLGEGSGSNPAIMSKLLKLEFMEELGQLGHDIACGKTAQLA